VAVPTPPLDWSRTRAYTSVVSTGEGVSVNLVGREPNGTVERADYERVRDEVGASLLAFEDPETGAHPIAQVARKEEVLSGPYLDQAPDLLLQPAPLYSLARARHMVAPADWLSGDHRPEGIYVFAGQGIAANEEGAEISLADFAEQIARAIGLEPDAEWSRAPVTESVGAYSAEEERQVEERLRGLGYLE
jgi:predicted AlkP superfamily phosphohydrolase/phosphomutase